MSAGREAHGVNSVDEKRLPRSIGGLFGLAFESYAEHARLYVLLALAAFAVAAIAEWVLPAVPVPTPRGQFKLFVVQFTTVFADAYIIAAVALGVGARVGSGTSSAGAVAGAATERWLRVIAVTLFTFLIVGTTFSLSGLQGLAPPVALSLIAIPFTWLLWGILGLAAPIAALSSEPAGLAIVVAFGRAFMLSLQRANLGRLCLVATLTAIVSLAQAIVLDQLVLHHVARPFFWAAVPIDALTVGPLAALQTAFALDFARRSGALEPPKP